MMHHFSLRMKSLSVFPTKKQNSLSLNVVTTLGVYYTLFFKKGVLMGNVIGALEMVF